MPEEEIFVNKVTLNELKDIAQRWSQGGEIRMWDDPLIVELAEKAGVTLEEGKQYVMVAHGARGGFYQPIIDEIGLIATDSTAGDWTLVVAGTTFFLSPLDTISKAPPEERAGKWNVWLAPVNSKVLEDKLDVTSPWFDYKDPSVLGWSEEKMRQYLVRMYGKTDHKYLSMVRFLRILPVKYRIGKY
ncbi:MAG: hypothetical protein ABIE03_03675 [Patescibacteria group bacterium]|nr:hypothetical protein [Patescibacteria group bacterium]